MHLHRTARLHEGDAIEPRGTLMTTTTNRLSTRLAAGALVAGIALLGAPAYAESMSAGDPADATASLYDIRKVSANHQDTKLVVEVKVTDLLLESDGGPASMSLFIGIRKSCPASSP